MVEGQFKLDDKRAFAHNGYEGILIDPPTRQGFLAIDRIDNPPKARTNKEFKVKVKVNHRLTKPTSIFLAIQPEESERWLSPTTEVLKGDGIKTFTLKLTAPPKAGEWMLWVKAYYLNGLRWLEADSMPLQIRLDGKYPREINVSGRKIVDRGDFLEEEYYKLTIEVDNEGEVEEAEAYGRAIINSWLAEPPRPPLNQPSP